MNKKFAAYLAGSALAIALGNSYAVSIPLAPGTAFLPVAGATTSVGVGATLEAHMTSALVPTVTPPIDSGILESWVYSGDVNNLLGGLTFVYQISLTGGQFNQLALNGWGTGSTVNVGYDALPGQAVPVLALRSDFPAGNPIDFNFGIEITGGTTAKLIIQTDETKWVKVTEVIQDGGQAKAVGFAPAVPDGGTTAIMLGVGFLGVASVRRKLA